MKNAFSVDVEELECVLRESCGLPPARVPRFVAENTEYTLRLLGEFGLQATFFINGGSVDAHPGLIRSIADRGHEIAAHSYSHRFLSSYPSAEAFRLDLERCVELIQRETGKCPIGYRAPGNTLYRKRVELLPVLKEMGFLYDSSFPSFAHRGQQGYSLGPDQPFRWDCGIVELPMPCYRLFGFRFPLVGAHALRLCPYWCTARGLRLWNNMNLPGFLYVHSFDFIDQPVSRACLWAKFPTNMVYLARRGLQMENKLRRLFTEFEFCTYQELFTELQTTDLPLRKADLDFVGR